MKAGAAPGDAQKAPAAASSRRLAAFLVGGALISKGLGFGREVLMAHILGASLVADCFRGSMTAVLLPFSLLQNESVPAILIPMHRSWQETGNGPRAFAALTGALTIAATLLMVLIQALGLYWVDAIVGGFSPQGRLLTLEFVRIMALGMPALVMLNCLAASELAVARSRLTTLRAIVLNLSVLVGLALLAVTGQLNWLAWSFALSFNGLAAWGAWRLWQEGALDPSGLRAGDLWDAGAVFFKRLRPLLALPVAEQSNMWLERALASRLVTGTVASMDYARTITDCALFLIGQPLGLAVLSSKAEADTGAQAESITRPLLAVAVPASVFLALFAPDIARVVFSRGAFDEQAVFLSSQAMRGIAAGLWASTLGWIMIRFLNKTGQNGKAALAFGMAYGSNILWNVATARVLGVEHSGPLLLGLGEALRGMVFCASTALMLGCARRLLRSLVIAAVPALAMLFVGQEVQSLIGSLYPRLLAGGLAYLLCVAFGGALLVPQARKIVGERVRSTFVGVH